MRKLIISPSILSADFANLERDVKIVCDFGAEYVHIDVMDGHFVPNITIGAPVVKSLRKTTNAVLDVHLMIDNPEKYIDDFISAGSDIVTIHLESTTKVKDIIDKLHNKNVKVGISIKPKTSWMDVVEYLPMIDMVLVMSVEPGFGGQSFMEDSLDKVVALKRIIDENKFDVDIEIDGGINLETGKRAVDAGCNVLVAGSAIYGSNDISKVISDFLNIK